MSAHSIGPGRCHIVRPRPPWRAEYRHARTALWQRFDSAMELVATVVCWMVLIVVVVLLPVVLLTGCDTADWPVTDGPATTGPAPTVVHR